MKSTVVYRHPARRRKRNKKRVTLRNFGGRADVPDPASFLRDVKGNLARGTAAVILSAFKLRRRVRLVVRTRPSQGRCTGSTPVRAAIHETGVITRQGYEQSRR